MKQIRTRKTLLSKVTALFVIGFVVVSMFGFTLQNFKTARAASAPNIISYQGRILNVNSVPVTDASLAMKFELYTAASGGTCLWSNSSADCDTNTPASTVARSVTLTGGLFSELLGDTADASPYAAIADTVFADNAAVYLQVYIAGEALSPRKQIAAVPYALNADTLDGADSTTFLTATGDTATGNHDYTGAIFMGASPLVFEGLTDDANQTTFAFADPSGARTVTFKDESGTVAYLSDITGSASLWTDGGAVTYLTSTTDGLAVGGTNVLASPFGVDVANNAVYIGSGATSNGNIIFKASNAATGTLTYGTGDSFDFTGGNITTDGNLALNGGSLTSTATTFNFDIGNTGSLLFRDGANTLMTLADAGTTGNLTITGDLGAVGGSFSGNVGAVDATFSGNVAVNGGTLSSTATTLNIDVGNTGSMVFRDGTNMLMTLADAGTTGNLTTSGDLIVSGGDITLGTTSIFSGGDVASLNNIDALDATTTTTVSSALTSLPNLTSATSLASVGTLTTGATGAGFTVNLDASTLTCTDCLDFTAFADTLTLDTALIVNQGTNTSTQNFTGDTTTGLTYNANSVTAGGAQAISANALTTGFGLGIASTSANRTSGNLLLVDQTADYDPGSPTNISGAAVYFNESNTNSSATQSLTVSSNSTEISRTTRSNNASATTNVTGSVLGVFSNALNTTGTVTDSGNVLYVNQQYSASTGDVVYILNNGSGNSISANSGGFTVAANSNVATSGNLAVNGGTISTTATTLALNVADTGQMVFTDGTNTLMMLTDSGTTGNLTATGDISASGNLGTSLDLTVSGGDITLGTTSIFSGGDTASLNNIDALDATTTTTVSSALTSLPNLTSATSLASVGTLTTGATGAGFTVNLDASTLTCTDCLDFTAFADTLTLDTALIVNQGTNTSTQNFTGSTTTGLTYNANSVTTGIAQVINANALTTGQALSVSSNSLVKTSGDLVKIDHTGDFVASGLTEAGSLLSLNQDLTNSSIGGLVISGDTAEITRLTTSNNAAAEQTSVTGSVLGLSSDAVNTFGVVADESSILKLTQNYASASGAVLNIDNLGLGDSINVNAGDFRVATNGNISTIGNLVVNGGTVSTTAAVLALSVADTGQVVFTDGTNTLMMLTDSGTTGNLTATGDITANGNLSTSLDLTVSGGDITLGTTSIFSGGDTASLNNIDALDITTTNTISMAIESLPMLTSATTLGAVGTLVTGATGAGFNVDLDASTLTCTNCLNFTEFASQLTLDSMVQLFQGSYAWQDYYYGVASGRLYHANSVAAGIAQTINVNGLTTGTGLYVASTSKVITSGDVVNFSHTPDFTAAGTVSGSVLDTNQNITNSSGGLLTLSGNTASVTRSTTANSASSSSVVTGAVLALSNSATETIGTVTDSGNVLSLTQNFGFATGDVVGITNNGVGSSIDITNTNDVSGAGIVEISALGLAAGYGVNVNIDSSLTTGSAYRVYAPTALTDVRAFSVSESDPPTETIYIETDGDIHIPLGSICIDNDSSCTSSTDGTIYYRSAVTTGGDLAEVYQSTEILQAGDIVVIDNASSLKIKESTSAYEQASISVVATNPGNLMNGPTEAELLASGINPSTALPNWGNYVLPPGSYPVALAGRVPTRVNTENGAIAVGDLITTSSTAGAGMKSTMPGAVVGRALQAWSGPGEGVIEVYILSGWHSGGAIANNGTMGTLNDNFAITAIDQATTTTTGQNSNSLFFQGSGWDGTAAQAVDMVISNDVTDSTNYKLSVKNDTGAEVAYISQSGDIALSGKLYPSDRGTLQTNKYIFYDGSAGPSGDFMRTNAAGWATGSYDFAEMFPSNDRVVPGEVVVFAADNQTVQRSTGTTYDRKLVGIISTRPGFLAGENIEGHVPVALAGRVPTFVTNENGAIAPGDPLTTSSTPGYAMKATEAGSILGYAMESFNGTMGSIITFVRASYYDGGPVVDAPAANNIASGLATTSNLDVSGTLNLNAGNVINVSTIAGLGNRWIIKDNGDLITEGRITHLVKSYQNTDVETYAALSRETTIQLSGTATLNNGTAVIRFENIDPDFNDVISNIDTYRVFLTASEATNSLYAVNRTNEGFTIQESNGNSNAVIDWLVIAYHKDYAPIVTTPQSIPSQTATSTPVINTSSPATATPVITTSTASTTPVITAPLDTATSTPVVSTATSTPVIEPVANSEPATSTQTATSTMPIITSLTATSTPAM